MCAMRAQKLSREHPRGAAFVIMELEEDWKECSTLYSRAKVVTEGGEDLLSCRALFSDDQR